MSVLEAPWDSFEERNLVLQALLGCVSAGDAFAAICARERATVEPEAALEGELHPLVLVALGLLSFRIALRTELKQDLGALPRAAQNAHTGAQSFEAAGILR